MRIMIMALATTLAVMLVGCGSQSHTTRPSAKQRAELAKLERGGPSKAQLAYVRRACAVPNHSDLHSWLDHRWGGRSTNAVAGKLAALAPGHASHFQREVLVNDCIARISATSS